MQEFLMSYCINPWCQEPQNPDHLESCQSCGTELSINERYQLLSPLNSADDSDTKLYEIDNGGTRQVMKVLTVNKPTLVRLFRQEAHVLRQLQHPGIPQVETDFIFSPRNGPKQLHCIVMEKIPGSDLETWLKHNPPLLPEQAIDWLRQLTEILDYVHRNGFFHRDIKPSNIMVRPDGRLVLIDFGAARKITKTYQEKIDLGQETTGVYSPGGYTAVEQLLGRAVPQSDFFSLGRTFVQLLTGQLPENFPELDSGKLIWREKEYHISEALGNLIDNLMAPEVEERPRNTSEILQSLAALDRPFDESTNVSKTRAQGKNNQYVTEAVKIGKNRKRWSDKKKKWRLAGYLGMLCLTMTSYHFLSPQLAHFLNQRGMASYQMGKFQEAENYYKWALKFNPDNVDVRNNMGIILETRSEREEACHEYRVAKNADSPAGYNNLAHCYILSGDYDTAVGLLLQGLRRIDSKEGKYAILKNLGWARLGQGFHAEAESHLREASEMMGDRAPAYCLLAQVLEAQGKEALAKAEWENCLRYASRYDRDEEGWIAIAKARLGATQ